MSRGRLWALIAAAAAVVVAAAVFFAGSGRSADEYRELLRDKDVALGLLENLRTDEADPLLASLAERLPDELFPVRNLAVCRLLALINGVGDVEQAQQAIERMLQFEQQSPASLWVAAKFLTYDGSRVQAQVDAAIELLERAAQAAPADLSVRYELYQLARYSENPEHQKAGRRALEQAFQADPDNIYLLTLWLELLAEQRDPRLAETVRRARSTVAPLESQVLRETRISITELMDETAELVETGAEFGEIRAAVQRIRNLAIFPEVTRRDLVKAEVHPLDLVVSDFSGEFYERAPTSVVDPPEAATPVDFRVWDGPRQPGVSGATAVRLADMNLDGRVDLVVLDDAALRLLLATEEGDWMEAAAAEMPGPMRGFALGDLDRDRAVGKIPADPKELPEDTVRGEPTARDVCHDADLDIIVYGDPGIVVLRNETDAADPTRRDLQRVEQPTGAADTSNPNTDGFTLSEVTRVRDAVLVDVDHDADLDIVASTDEGLRIWMGLGENMQFEEISRWSSLPDPGGHGRLKAVDWDRDVDVDLIVADRDGQATGVLENMRHGQFRWRAWGGADDDDLPRLEAIRDLAVLEADGNVSWDYALLGERGAEVLLTDTGVTGSVRLLNRRPVAASDGDGLLTLDFDNDGIVDLAVWSRERVRFFRGDGRGAMAPVDSMTIEPGAIDGAAADVDRDGDLDLALLGADGTLRLLENRGGSQNHWLGVRAMGRIDNRGRCNHTGLGAIVEVKTATHYQAQVIDEQTLHFGMGKHEQASAVRIVWTNGIPQTVIQPPTDLALCELMILKGSCPYVYTWDGEGYQFFTDCLWAAPLGLQVADGVPAPSRAWEYLRIPGERLTPDATGHYRLQLTEELWEAAYFDQVELLAVDHPADFEVYSNEKVGPAEIAQFHVHTVRHPRKPLAAKDQRGRDVLSLLAERDGRFVKAFDRRRWQGLVEDHHLELDLGELRGAERITLFLTGWIYPTDTSLNIAFSQNPDQDGPRLPQVLVPDAEGRWQPTVAYMGFPGGKTKTIAVDLSDAFLCDDFRVRIATNAEIYWDDAFFTVDEPAGELQLTRLRPSAAELHYRGFSKRLPARDFGPERYDYQRVDVEPRWPPMRGRFTRYGDVLPLLLEPDDQMATLGAGDEMSVAFRAPPPPPPGWKRDFLLHCVGWDKDADLNTYYGQSVEPLPFRAMRSYPYAADESYPDTAAHRAYLRTYQTRTQNANAFWRQIRDHRDGQAAP